MARTPLIRFAKAGLEDRRRRLLVLGIEREDGIADQANVVVEEEGGGGGGVDGCCDSVVAGDKRAHLVLHALRLSLHKSRLVVELRDQLGDFLWRGEGLGLDLKKRELEFLLELELLGG